MILRDLIDAKITNDQFVHQFPRSADDLALPAILKAAWMQFSDRRVYRLTGRDTPNARGDGHARKMLALFDDEPGIPMAAAKDSHRQGTVADDWGGQAAPRV